MDELHIEHTGYFLVPDEIFEIERLSIHAQSIYQVLCRHANAEGKCWPGYARISKMARCSAASVKRAVEELQKTDPPLLIVEQRKKGKQKDTNLYTLRRRDLRGGRVPQTLGVGSHRPQGRVPQTLEGRLNEGRHNEGQEQPAPPALVGDHRQQYLHELELRWEKLKDSDNLQQIIIVGLECMNHVPFGNYQKEQKAAARLVEKLRTVCNGQGEREFLRMLVGAYVHMKKTSKAEFWKGAPLTPSALDTRFDATYEQLRKRAVDFKDGEENRQLLERLMKK